MIKKDFLIVIPARMGSTRFPGKVLAPLNGKPIVEWCRQAALEAQVGPVIVATEDKAVAQSLKEFKAYVVMTSPKCHSGTDRVFEAVTCGALQTRGIKYVINLQGDEPLIQAETIRSVADILRKYKDTDIATAVVPLNNPEAAQDSNTVKVAMGAGGRCLYFSRAPIPWGNSSIHNGSSLYLKHIGIYAYRMDPLKRFVKMPPAILERRESLEQLRALEAGMTIRAAVVHDHTIAIDTPEDLSRAEQWLQDNPQKTITKGARTHG